MARQKLDGVPWPHVLPMVSLSKLSEEFGMCSIPTNPQDHIGRSRSENGSTTETNALLAALFPAGPALAMPRFDGFPIMAVIMIMIDLSMLRRIFRQVCVKRIYLCHRHDSLVLDFLPAVRPPISEALADDAAD